MPSPKFSLLLSASDCASLREALALDFAVKLAQGDTAGAEVLTALRERVDTAATVPVGDAVPTGTPHAGQAGAVYNTISGGSARDAVQCRDINGNIDLR